VEPAERTKPPSDVRQLVSAGRMKTRVNIGAVGTPLGKPVSVLDDVRPRVGRVNPVLPAAAICGPLLGADRSDYRVGDVKQEAPDKPERHQGQYKRDKWKSRSAVTSCTTVWVRISHGSFRRPGRIIEQTQMDPSDPIAY
jgi:hypothetical protein